MSTNDDQPNQASVKEQKDIPQTILILKSNANSMKSAEIFLRNRQWSVSSTTQMREAIAFIIQKRPSYVMISADHPNKKVKVLPKLITQAFPCRIIAFAEQAGGNSIAALHEIGVEYSLFPPVSGPAIERIVLKMLRDEEKRLKEGQIKLSADNNDPNSSIAIESGSNQSGFTTIQGSSGETNSEEIKKSLEQARNTLSQLISSELDESSESKQTGPAYLGHLEQPGQGNSQNDQNHSSLQMFSANTNKQMTSMLQTGDPYQQSGAMLQTGDPYQQSGAMLQTGDPYQQSGAMLQKGSDKLGRKPIIDQDGNSLNPDESAQAALDQNKHRSQVKLDLDSSSRPGQLKAKYKFHTPIDRDNESIIIRGTQTALDETARINNSMQTINEIEKVSNLACIEIVSSRFSGYLVAALGKNRKIDQEFMNMIRLRLFSFLRSHGETITESETSAMALNIQEIEFEDWAFEHAQFLRKSVHDGDEIAMAFFPSTDTKVRLEDSVSDKMVKMNLNDLRDDTVIEFDLYLFMPENNKYLLYTPQGRPIYKEQKNRLNQKGVTHMHLRKESAIDVKKYKTQNFLNDKIELFKTVRDKKIPT